MFSTLNYLVDNFSENVLKLHFERLINELFNFVFLLRITIGS